jgi:hypothetical protein
MKFHTLVVLQRELLARTRRQQTGRSGYQLGVSKHSPSLICSLLLHEFSLVFYPHSEYVLSLTRLHTIHCLVSSIYVTLYHSIISELAKLRSLIKPLVDFYSSCLFNDTVNIEII